jgi:fumarate reductase flavoprotein subunit
LKPYDLLVAGAGGGLIGAIKAAQLGLNVLLIDASDDFIETCNTSRTTGMFPGAERVGKKIRGLSTHLSSLLKT